MTGHFAYYGWTSAFQLKWQHEHQKLCALGRHESLRCSTSTFIWCQSCCVVRHFRHSSSRPILWRSNINELCNILCNCLSLCSYAAKNVLELLQQNALNDFVWMKDGAPPHVAKSVRRVLEQHFGDRIISHRFPFSVASAIPWSDSYNFLVLGIYQIQS